MTSLKEIDWEDCLLEASQGGELERRMRRELGVIPPLARYFFACPWIVQAVSRFAVAHLRLAHVDAELAELINLVVSQDNSCRYCYAASRALLKVLGVPERRVRQLEEDLLTAEVSPHVRQALDLCRRISRARPLPSSADGVRVQAAGWSAEGVKELAATAAGAVFLNRLSTLPALPTESLERLERGPLLRLLRPLLAAVLRRRIRAAHHAAPAGACDVYPGLTAAFGDLPAGAMFTLALEEAWASPFLARRAKALVFAVVARGLGCASAENEALRLLRSEGLDDGASEVVLANLSSPRLDELESVVVPFARETIWYRPAAVQQRARLVRDRLSHDQFVELIGVCSLANGVCRLYGMLEP